MKILQEHVGKKIELVFGEPFDAEIVFKDPLPTPDISTCPRCGVEADNGFDRCDPPSPYYCSKCQEKGVPYPTPTKSSFPMPKKLKAGWIVDTTAWILWATELQKYDEKLEARIEEIEKNFLTLSGKVGANSGYLRAYKERLEKLEDVVGAIVLHNTSKQCETQSTQEKG